MLLPPFFVPLVPIGLLYVKYKNYFIPTAREIRRIDSVVKSPLYAHFGETLNGLSTIRAFNQQRRFVDESEERLGGDHPEASPWRHVIKTTARGAASKAATAAQGRIAAGLPAEGAAALAPQPPSSA